MTDLSGCLKKVQVQHICERRRFASMRKATGNQNSRHSLTDASPLVSETKPGADNWTRLNKHTTTRAGAHECAHSVLSATPHYATRLKHTALEYQEQNFMATIQTRHMVVLVWSAARIRPHNHASLWLNKNFGKKKKKQPRLFVCRQKQRNTKPPREELQRTN